MKHEVDILVVSYAAFRSVNRAVYRFLQKEYDLNIEVVAPKYLKVSGSKVDITPSPSIEDEIIHFLELRSQNPRLMTFKKILRVASCCQPKVIYLDNDPGSVIAIQLGLWCKLNNSKLICLTCENLPASPVKAFRRRGVKGFLFGLLKVSLLKVSTLLVNHVFTINNDGTKLYKKHGFKSVSKTPLGFDPDVFYSSSEARQKVRSHLGLTDQYVFAYIGRLVPEKGVDILLDSLAALKKMNWILLMDQFVAQDDYSLHIENKIKSLELADHIIHFHADHTEVASYMNAADTVVVPSIDLPEWVEQYGRVAPEAMACGKLVVASNTGALPELIGSAGILVPPGNKDELTNTLREIILTPEKFEHLKPRAEEYSHKHLSIKAQAKNIHEAFMKLCF